MVSESQNTEQLTLLRKQYEGGSGAPSMYELAPVPESEQPAWMTELRPTPGTPGGRHAQKQQVGSQEGQRRRQDLQNVPCNQIVPNHNLRFRINGKKQGNAALSPTGRQP